MFESSVDIGGQRGIGNLHRLRRVAAGRGAGQTNPFRYLEMVIVDQVNIRLADEARA
jgi:hypothetical protein